MTEIVNRLPVATQDLPARYVTRTITAGRLIFNQTQHANVCMEVDPLLGSGGTGERTKEPC